MCKGAYVQRRIFAHNMRIKMRINGHGGKFFLFVRLFLYLFLPKRQKRASRPLTNRAKCCKIIVEITKFRQSAEHCEKTTGKRNERMNIVYLKYAAAVAKAGSLSKAAEELAVAQPNLSRAIKELEKELDITIFDRKPKGIVLTPDGERLLNKGRRIIRDIEQLETEFKERGGEKAAFSLSAPREDYIAAAFSRFSRTLTRANRCEAYYKETNGWRTLSNVLEKEYKLGILHYAAGYDKEAKEMLESKNLTCELIAEFRALVTFSSSSPLALLDEVKLSDLENYAETAYGDPYVPSVSPSEIKKEELPEGAERRIFVFERAAALRLLAENEDTYMWSSPLTEETLSRYALKQRAVKGSKKIYRDVLAYPKNYALTAQDKAFVTCLCEEKRKLFR